MYVQTSVAILTDIVFIAQNLSSSAKAVPCPHCDCGDVTAHLISTESVSALTVTGRGTHSFSGPSVRGVVHCVP